MKYLVICKDKTSFTTNWFEKEKHWSDDIFCVVNNYADKITFDGETWNYINFDHL